MFFKNVLIFAMNMIKKTSEIVNKHNYNILMIVNYGTVHYGKTKIVTNLSNKLIQLLVLFMIEVIYLFYQQNTICSHHGIQITMIDVPIIGSKCKVFLVNFMILII